MEITHSEKSSNEDYSDFQKSLNNIGTLIKNAREQKNLTIDSLAENLKINKSYLLAIENGDSKSLPEIIYVKAMMRRISEKLQIDLDIQNVFNKNLRLKKDNLSRKEEIKTLTIKKAFIIIPLLAFTAVFLGAITVKVGVQWLLIKSEPTENIIKTQKNNK